MEQATFTVTVQMGGKDATKVLDDLVAQANDERTGGTVAKWVRSVCSYTPDYDGLAFIVDGCVTNGKRGVVMVSPLTPRELEVLKAVALGNRNKEIARTLLVTERTVKAHLASVFFKLGVDDRTSAVAVAVRNGWIS